MFRNGSPDSCAIARKQCFLADSRREKRVRIRDDFARIKLHNSSAPICLLPLTGHKHLLYISCPRRPEPATEADEGGIQARVWPSRLRHRGVASRSTRHQVRRPEGLAVQRRAVARALRNNEQMLSTKRAARWDCHPRCCKVRAYNLAL